MTPSRFHFTQSLLSWEASSASLWRSRLLGLQFGREHELSGLHLFLALGPVSPEVSLHWLQEMGTGSAWFLGPAAPWRAGCIPVAHGTKGQPNPVLWNPGTLWGFLGRNSRIVGV